jgi:hypothetical protein
MFLVVSKSPAEDDSRPDAGQREGMRRADFTRGQCAARFIQTDPPAAVGTGAHSHDPTRYDYVRTVAKRGAHRCKHLVMVCVPL